MKEYIIAITTCPEAESYKLAQILVDTKVCACVNIIPSVKSVYNWKGDIITDSEAILFIKTEARFEEMLKSVITKNHSYELPEFIVLKIESGSKDYLEWISANLLMPSS
ncbi:divalent-cation tolerance protein CutA [Candidatus Thorarchaeota archaeon]|nr:MAG: divalent-cation tolerance protein CutA [Candidatus Thorarchaeota archaeon]